MPRLTRKNPAYRKHKASGRAIVTLDGQDVYLGPYGSKASRDEYDRLIGEWLANGRRLPGSGGADLSVAEILLAFWKHAQTYYRLPDGTPTSQVENYRQLIRLIRKLYGRKPVAEFGPLSLRAVQQEMIKAGWCRKTINCYTQQAKHIFKWAASHELVPPVIYHGLQSVPGLRKGKTEARESDPVQPVPEEHVEAIKDHVSDPVWAMTQLQLATGMRPGEVLIMRPVDIDTAGKLWVYRPSHHKTAHHGHEREIYLGPRAQEIVGPYLAGRAVDAYLFSPAEAQADRRQERHEARETPMSYGNRPGTNRQQRPKRTPGDRYDVTAYRRAIARGCEVAFGMPAELYEPRGKKARKAESALPPDVQKKRKEQRRKARAEWRQQHVWHPHQLRHNAATRLRKEYGLEAAQVILGHKTLAVTQIYAEKNVEAAKRIMGEVG